MPKLLIYDKDPSGVLISLDDVLARLPVDRIDIWQVRYLAAIGIAPFDVPISEFEALTRTLTSGVVLTFDELRIFRDARVQVTDGEFVGLSFATAPRGGLASLEDLCLLRLECVDAGFWECETNDADILTAISHSFVDVRQE